ncbi:hypothetical protein KY285_019286 [Solanum tuberosum]|nr:hypothetical protein KY285_019286 [Solanum tuberosum]
MQRKNQQLKKEEAEEKEAAKNRAVHVSLIQKMLQHLEAKDDDIVEVNTKPSTANAHLQQKQLSPAAPPSVHSTANANGNGSGK